MSKTFTTQNFNQSIATVKKNVKTRLCEFRLGLMLHIILAFFYHSAESATITSTASGGNWNATNTWVGGVIPNLEDEVVIESGALVTINQNITCAGLTVHGTLSTDGTNRNVTINGALTIYGSFDLFRCNPLIVKGNTTIYGNLFDTHNNGSAVFQGLITIANGGTFTPTTTSAFTFHNGIANHGTFNKTGTGLVSFSTNAQNLDGTNPIFFSGAVTIGSGVALSNHNYTTITGILSGIDNTSIWINATNATLDYRSGTMPMATGILNASARENTVIYNADANQTIKVTNYHHLHTGTNGGTTLRTKTLESSIGTIRIAGNLTVGDWSVFNLGLGNKSILVDGNVALETANTWLRTANTDNAIHELTIGGILQINGGEVRLRYLGTSRYCDLTMTASGNIIQGKGSLFYLRNLTLTNPDAKQSTYSDNINFYSGSNSPNQFTNNGGPFTSSAGNIIFRDDNVDWSVGGTGAITFANLQIGASTRTNVILNRDVTVENNLNLYQNAAANYLDINGYTLTLNGNHTRQGSGRIRGGGTSALIINGIGNFTNAFFFDQTTSGTTNRLAQLNYNRNGLMLLGNLLSIDLLNIHQGTLNAATGSIQVNQTANLLNGRFIDDNNSGTNAFNGITTISETSAFEVTSNSMLYLSGTIHNHGSFAKSGTGETIFTENTTLNGQAVYRFTNGRITISNNVEVINNASAENTGVQIDGQLNGASSGSRWKNNGILIYRNASEPMSTGILDAAQPGNTVTYARDQNNQPVKGANYHHLQLKNGGLRILKDNITVNGNLTLGEETALHTEAFQITGNTTGSFTMTEFAELQIGNAIFAGPNFPTGFTRESIIFDPNSQIAYNGTIQHVSHVPVYANLTIASAGNKTITGDVTVNGNLKISAGVLAFDAETPQTLTVFADLLGSGGEIDMSGGGHAHTLELYGKLNQLQRFTNAPNSIVRYASGENQQIFSPAATDSYGVLEIAGGSTKTTELTLQVNGSLQLTSGKIDLRDQDLVIFGATITGNFSADNMIETNGTGRLIRRAGSGTADLFTGFYPIGSGGKFSPVTIQNMTGDVSDTCELRLRAINGRHPNVLTDHDALLRYWELTTNNITNAQAGLSLNITHQDIMGDVKKFKAFAWDGNIFDNPEGSFINPTSLTFPDETPLNQEFTAYDEKTIRRTLYAQKDGPWSDLETWTTDPSGEQIIGADVPVSSDNVVILPSRTVHLNSHIDEQGLIITIEGGGILDMGIYQFQHPISTLKGQGTLKLASNAMPQTALNTLVEPEGGTIEYNVADSQFEFNEHQTYNNLTINLTNPSNKAILTHNLTVEGDLRIIHGVLSIYKDDVSANLNAPISLNVKKNILLEQQGSIITGTASTHNGSLPVGGTIAGSTMPRYYDVYHKVHIGGNLINNGSVRFISGDVTEIDFANLTTRGAVSVRFYGASDGVINCNGTTDFYNLIIDKENGPGFEMELNATEPNFFRLFGANIYNSATGGVNPEVRKALWMRNGTLRLTGHTTIATLTEGRGGINTSAYIIPANGALILDGPNVTVLVTADKADEVVASWGISGTGVHAGDFPQELIVIGKLVVNDGYLSTRFSSGIVFNQLVGEMVVNGGTVAVRQIRSTSSTVSSFRQNGGHINLLGGYTFDTSGLINTIDDIRNIPILQVHTNTRINSTAAFNWSSSSNHFTMTGGAMHIYNTTGNDESCALRILSAPENLLISGGVISIHITRDTKYNMESSAGNLPGLTILGTNARGMVQIQSNLIINGNLNLEGNAILNANASGYNLSLAGDFNIGANAFYLPNQNNTRFFGDVSSVFTFDGNITNGLFNFTVDKKSGEALMLAGSSAYLSVNQNLNLLSGILNDGGKTILAKGNIHNAATHTGTGTIKITNGLTTHIIGGNGSGIFGNLELEEANGIETTLTAHQQIAGNFTLTDGRFNLSNYGLTLNNLLLPVDPSHFTEEKMFTTSGNPSDAGLIRLVQENGTVLFPVGTSESATTIYSPVELTVSDLTAPGYIQINPVARELPLLNPESNNIAIQRYWQVNHKNFEALPNVSYLFSYDEQDVPVTGDEAQLVPGKVVGTTRTHLTNGVNTIANTLLYAPAEILITASYTAAHPDRLTGAASVFYSRQCGTVAADWFNLNTWSKTSHTGTAADEIPGAGDVVYIGHGGGCNPETGGDFHWVYVDDDLQIGELNFTQVPEGTGLPRLIIPQNKTIDIGKVSGTGSIMIQLAATGKPNIQGDWNNFLMNDSSLVVYNITADGIYNLTGITNNYPNLNIQGNGNSNGNRIVTITDDVVVRSNFSIDEGATMLLNNGTQGNITVAGNSRIGTNNFGHLMFQGEGSTRRFATKDLTIGNQTSAIGSSLVVSESATGGLLHELVLTGSLTQNGGTIDLFTNHTGGSNVDLQFTGVGNALFNGYGVDIPELYQMVINKGSSPSSGLSIHSNFTVAPPPHETWKAINLINGTLSLNHPAISLTLSSGGNYFQIPASTAFIVSQGQASISAHNNGINLMGKLAIINNGQLILGNGTTDNLTDVQYQGLHPEIEISGNGKLEVNSQIRRMSNSLNGALKYMQTGGELIIHGLNHTSGRAKLEVVNPGSHFKMSGGTIHIVRGSGTTFGDVYLMPQTSQVTAGEIRFSQGSVNTNQNYLLQTNVPLFNLTISGNTLTNNTASLKLMTQPLTVIGTMLLENNKSIFNSNNLNNTFSGSMTVQGTWLHGATDVTTFNGTAQTISGSLVVNNAVVNPSVELRLLAGSHLTVNGNIYIADAGDFILESETGADKLASLITKGSVTGTTKIKLTLPANQWFYVASPIKTPTFGNFDTGIDEAKVHVHRNAQWYSTGLTHTAVPLKSMEGVSVKYTNTKTLYYDGGLNTASHISRTYDTPGWYLMGNPYPSFINWQENAGWSRPNIDNTIWYRTFDGSQMVFITYNRAAASGAKVAFYPSGQALNNEAVLANIPPMQSVWVKALAATTISVKRNARNHGVAGSQLKSSTTGSNAHIIRITANNGFSRDGVVIYFSEETTNGIDAGDSEKRFNDSQAIPELFTRIGSTAAAINGLQMLGNSSQTIPLNVLNKVSDDVTLNFDLSLFQSAHNVYLEDKVTNQIVNLLANPNYNYTPSMIGEAHERFVIHIGYSATTTGIVDSENATTSDITITCINGQALVRISCNNIKTHHARIEVFTTDGRKVSDATTRAIETLINLPKTDALFVVKVTVGDVVKTEKITGRQ